jgi:aerobic C4-dicarboxylate transport protein
VAAWEGDIDRERAHAVLDGRMPVEEDLGDVEATPPVPAPTLARTGGARA